MTSQSTRAATARQYSTLDDELLPLLALLPAIVLSWPGPNPIAGDFATTELSGTGVALLASIPAALYVAWRRARPVRGTLLLLLSWLALAALSRGTDSLQRDRTWMVMSVAVLLTLAGGGLGPRGRALFVRGLAFTSGLLLARALLVPSMLGGEQGLGGVLGNSGELSAAALPGALAGMQLWAREWGKSRWLGLVVIALFVVHAVMAPVLTSLLALAGVALLAAALGRGPEFTGIARAKLTVLCLAAIAGLGWVKYESAPELQQAQPESVASSEAALETSSAFGGVRVRKLVWAATLELIREHPYRGVGAGQFAAAFPAYRDPAEIELSNWQRRIEAVTEVEHPHNDWLLAFAEGGLAVGITWVGFLLVVLLAALRQLRRGGVTRGALAAASLGVLVSALAGAPLTFNPPASVAAFALFGALLARDEESPTARGSRSGRLVAPAAAVVMLLFVPRAWSMWQLGLSLIETTETLSVTAQEISVDHALEQVPDSVVALSLKAQLVEHRERDLPGALAVWERVLTLRPLRFEALMNSGQLLARSGRLREAAARFDQAYALDAGHPGLLRNRIACAADRGRVDEALLELDRLEATGHADALWLRDLGCDLILRGKDREALPLLARADPRFAELTGEKAWALDAEYRRGGSHVAADAFKALAHVLWAREQAGDGEWNDARRSYRQNLRITRERVAPDGPTRLRMEMGAVLWRSRMPEDARAMLAGLEPDLSDWAAMPGWAGETLLELGFGE